VRNALFAGFLAALAFAAPTRATGDLLLPGLVDAPLLAGAETSCDRHLPPSDIIRWEAACVAVAADQLAATTTAYKQWLRTAGWAETGHFLGGDWFEFPDGQGKCNKVVVVAKDWDSGAFVSLWFTRDFRCEAGAK